MALRRSRQDVSASKEVGVHGQTPADFRPSAVGLLQAISFGRLEHGGFASVARGLADTAAIGCPSGIPNGGNVSRAAAESLPP